MALLTFLYPGIRSGYGPVVSCARRSLASLVPRIGPQSTGKPVKEQALGKPPTQALVDVANTRVEPDTSRVGGGSTASESSLTKVDSQGSMANKSPGKPLGGAAKAKREKKPKFTIEIFHDPNSPDSERALNMLTKARTEPFPPPSQASQKTKIIKRRRRGDPTHYEPAPIPPPLRFGLHLHTGTPTAGQFIEMKRILGDPRPWPAVFLSRNPVSSEYPTSAPQLEELVKNKPELLQWPIIVCWKEEVVSVGTLMQATERLLRKYADRRMIPKRGRAVYDPSVEKKQQMEKERRWLAKEAARAAARERWEENERKRFGLVGPMTSPDLVQDEAEERKRAKQEAELAAEEDKTPTYGLLRPEGAKANPLDPPPNWRTVTPSQARASGDSMLAAALEVIEHEYPGLFLDQDDETDTSRDTKSRSTAAHRSSASSFDGKRRFDGGNAHSASDRRMSRSGDRQQSSFQDSPRRYSEARSSFGLKKP